MFRSSRSSKAARWSRVGFICIPSCYHVFCKDSFRSLDQNCYVTRSRRISANSPTAQTHYLAFIDPAQSYEFQRDGIIYEVRGRTQSQTITGWTCARRTFCPFFRKCTWGLGFPLATQDMMSWPPISLSELLIRSTHSGAPDNHTHELTSDAN